MLKYQIEYNVWVNKAIYSTANFGSTVNPVKTYIADTAALTVS